MKYYDLKTDFGRYKVRIEKETYEYSGGLAIALITDEDELFAVMTVNLGGYCLDDNEAFVDTNNCYWAERFIKDNNLGKKTEFTGHSGYCEYPLYEFDLSKIIGE